MNTKPRYVVVGAGHGGKAMAAHLALMGFPVTLYNRTPEHVAVIKARGEIELTSYEGGPHGFGRLALVTSDIAEALDGADVIMVVVPSTAHVCIAKAVSPYLQDGQIVVSVVFPGESADQAGLRVGDVILAVDGVEFDADTSDAEAILLIRGPVGTPAHFVVKRGEEILQFNPIRPLIDREAYMREMDGEE